MSPIDWTDVVEQRIREAQERGEFDNLVGQGQPLNLRENPFVRPAWRLAYRILTNAGFSPDWIELDRTVRAELAQCHKLLEGQLLWARKVASSGRSDQEPVSGLADVYQWTVARYTTLAERANENIELLNLITPVMFLQKHKICIAEELRRFRRRWPQSRQNSITDPTLFVDRHTSS